MNSKLSIISYNCRSANSNGVIISDLLKKCDILCMQETLVDDNNSHLLDTLDNRFISAYVPSNRKPDCFVGRSSGGLAILWKPLTEVRFQPITFNSRIMGLRMLLPNDVTYLIINIYCICDYGTVDSLIEYKSTLADLQNILDSESFHDVIICGDLNADPSKGRFFNEIVRFNDENSLSLYDVNSIVQSVLG